MGLTMGDATQVATMYGCVSELKSFKLCTNKPDGCTTEACTCVGKLKVTENSCSKCLLECPASTEKQQVGSPDVCGCREGCTKSCFSQAGTQYCGCVNCPP